ncbi:hypothetical protein D3C81_773320 [compost metagenome]
MDLKIQNSQKNSEGYDKNSGVMYLCLNGKSIKINPFRKRQYKIYKYARTQPVLFKPARAQ